jgi:hypothetical protein
VSAEERAAREVIDNCVLCGRLTEVRMGLYRADGKWHAGRRCTDHQACDARRPA